MRKTVPILLVLTCAFALLGGCGGDDDGADTAAGDDATTPAREDVGAKPAAKVKITAQDFGFDVPPTFEGGILEIEYVNAGQEPHFAAFAAIAEGKTASDVIAVLSTPPTGAPPPAEPPPFKELAAMATMDPGVTAHATLDLPAGDYVLYCALPSPDGVPHINKGMASEVTVTEGSGGELPEPEGTFITVDFAFAGGADLTAGRHVVGLRNQGKQLHEIDLVEIGEGKTVEDVVAWFKTFTGPPPMKMLGGPAVIPGAEATATYDLRPGVDYAFVCTIPDFLGDFAIHATKGMYTEAFRVE